MTVSAAQSVSSCIAVYLLLKLQEGGSNCQVSLQDGLRHETPSMQGSPCHSEDEVKKGDHLQSGQRRLYKEEEIELF